MRSLFLKPVISFMNWKDDLMEKRKKAQGMVEWALIVALIAVALIALLIAVKGGIGNMLNKIIQSLQGTGQ